MVDIQRPFDARQVRPRATGASFAHHYAAPNKKGTAMRKPLRPVIVATIAAALALAGCKGDQTTTAKPPGKATTSDTGGSLKGDFGPPQGEPIEAVLT